MKKPIVILSALLFGAIVIAAPKTVVPIWTDAKKAAAAHQDFKLQGEYTVEGVGLQAADLGEGMFHVLTYTGGLPGAGWNGEKIKVEKLGREDLQARVADMKRVERKSPTLGKKAPDGAIVVFDGEQTEHFKGKVENGVLWSGAETTTPTGDFTMHLEFRLPFKPARNLSSQDRGNSGVYIFNNYELQVIDTFGLDFDTENNAVETESLNSQWCASLYKFKTPDEPMAYPPLQWQTYDIDFTAPKFEGDKKVKNARITLKHNGVIVHDDVELENGTGAGGKRPEKAESVIFFQDHGNPVAFRNIWMVKK